MSTQTTKERLEAVKFSLRAAYDVPHPTSGLSSEYAARHEHHIRGLKAGLSIAISAIDLELLMIEASEDALKQRQQLTTGGAVSEGNHE